MVSQGGRHTASRDIWLTSLKKKKKLVSANKILVYGLQHSSEKAEFGKKKKMKQQLKIVTHLPWNVNKLFLENMGLTII